MKLYTEEQVRHMIEKSQDTGLTAEYLMLTRPPIELPSDDDMANASNHCKDGQVKVGFLRGVIWMKEQILNQSTKQHIIDIMKADENDGLYNQNKS